MSTNEPDYETLPAWVKPGAKYRDASHYGKKFEVRAIVDDSRVVVRRWRQARWSYEVLHVYYFTRNSFARPCK